MVTRYVGVDSVAPRLPQGVITASQGALATDLAAGVHTHARADVGLGSVDNTSDAAKPVSTATQTALDAKLNLAGGTLTGSLVNKAPLYVDGMPILGRSADGVTARGTVTFGSTTLSISQPGAGNAVALVVNSASRFEVSDTLVTALVPIQLPADPTASNQAATKNYVDASRRISVVTNAGTGYTLSLADENRLVRLTANGGTVTVTIPPNSSVAFPIGARIDLAQMGTSKVTVAPGAGVTVNGTPGLSMRVQYSSGYLYKTATDTWLLNGDLST